MKIGFISSAFPLDPQKDVAGREIRMSMFIQAMKEMGELNMLFYVPQHLNVDTGVIARMEKRLAQRWDTDLRLDLCNMAPAKQGKNRWEEYVSPALSIVNQYPYLLTSQREQISAACRLLSKKPDILFVHRLMSMIPVLLSGRYHPRVYFDLDDIEHVAFMRSIKQPPQWGGKQLYYLRLPILMLWERRAVRFSNTAFVCSKNDMRYLSKVYRCRNVSVIPNAIDIPKEQDISDKPILLFLGIMSYPPNAEAADFLIRKIWPIILSSVPEARLLIAGRKPEHIQCFVDRPLGVEFLGFVEDLEKLYEKVRVVCCPILSGGGTRIKILEAAAHGKPVVSTTIGAEGIDLQNGEEILLHDDPRSFAEACIRLLKDRNFAMKIGKFARSVVSGLYDRNHVIESIRMQLAKPGG